MNAEEKRLAENDHKSERWHLWGPYLSERQWGTVREDYSANGDAWNYFTHDQARSRAYRWGEDGIGGVSDFKQRLCFAFAFWNERDPILKERLFGLTGPQGNHGEDGKEIFFYEDSTPTHSYMQMTYRYPQAAYPYEELVRQNSRALENEGGVRALGRRRVAREPFFRHHDRICEGRAGRSADSRDDHQSWAGSRADFMFCRPFGFATPGAGAATIAGRTCAGRPHAAEGWSLRRVITRSANIGCSAKARRSCSSRRTKPICSGSTACRTRRRSSKTRFTSCVVQGKTAAVNPEQSRNESGRALPAGNWRGRNARHAAAAGAPARALRFADFDEIFEQRRAEADEFHAALAPACLARNNAPSSGRRSPGCSGRSNFITTSSRNGWKAIPASRRRLTNVRLAGTRSGASLQRARDVDAGQAGNIPGMRRGIWPSIASRSRWSIRISRRVSSISFCANGISIRTGRSPPTSGISAT